MNTVNSMSATNLVDMVLDSLHIEVINTDEEELSGIWDISERRYKDLVKAVEREMRA